MRPGSALIPCLALAAVAALCTPSSSAAQAGRPEVVSLDFRGNTAFADAELERAIFTKASTCPFVLRVTTCVLGLDWGRDRYFYSSRALGDDLDRLRLLYRAHGFRGAAVDTSVVHRGDGGVSIEFLITEGSPARVGSIIFQGDSVAPELSFQEDLPLRPGDPLSFLLMDETSDTLATRLRNSGYAHAEVFKGYRLPVGSDSAVVTYTVDLGPRTTYGAIEISGNEILEDRVIQGRMPFRTGQLYRARQVLEAQRSLYELELIALARVEPDTSGLGLDPVIPIRVEVAEGDLRRVRTGGGLNTADCVNFEGRWTNRSFLGGGRILQARGRVSNLLASPLQSTPACADAGTGDYGQVNWQLGLDFSQPTFLSRRLRLVTGVFGERQSLKNIFVREAFGIDAGLNTSLGARAFLNARFQPQVNRLDAAEVILCATFLACAPDDIAVLQGSNWLAPVAVSFNQDRTDQVFSPRRGYRVFFDVEAAGSITGSDYTYLRTIADGSAFVSLDNRTVLALRSRAGRIDSGAFAGLTREGGGSLDVVPPQKRFYAGGANSIRGFGQSALGPRSLSLGVEPLLRRPAPALEPACIPEQVLALTCDASALSASTFQERPIGGLALFEASAELRFDFAGGAFGGAAFVDVGQAWPGDLSLGELEVAPGIGVRYNTLFGPIRLDVAYSLRGKEPLQVVTSQIRPFVPGEDRDVDRINIAPRGEPVELIDWVISEDLALLGPPVLFGDEPGFSIRRFQIHFSIGQAF